MCINSTFIVGFCFSKSDRIGFKISTSDFEPQLAKVTTVLVDFEVQPASIIKLVNAKMHNNFFMHNFTQSANLTSHSFCYSSIKTPTLLSFTSTRDLKPSVFTI